jgi:hypothetical protein
MDKPIKIIHKYKNQNRKVQYNILIFIGNILSEQLNNVLNKIKDKSLYDSLIELNSRDIELLNTNYGNKWYTYFFITKHIEYSFQKIIKQNESKIAEIKKKYGEEWYDTHIIQFTNISKTIYSYQSLYKYESDIKNKSKIKNNNLVIKNNAEQVGGKKNIEDESINLEKLEIENTESSEETSEEFDIEELEQISKEDVNINKEADAINKTLNQIIEKTDLESKNEKYGKIVKWNKQKDNNMIDEDLINIYTKTYIYNQYILRDDTIKMIKNKICTGYEKSEQFNKSSPYFMPSRLYLWIEYNYNDNDKIKTDRIMLGQKWINRGELLDIDIEPNNNLRNYEILKDNLKVFQENIKKYSSKITHTNDENDVLYDYDNFMTNNEIYMIDLYNELGVNYQLELEGFKNVFDTYIRIYYNGITFEDFKNIIKYLDKKDESSTAESQKINLIYKNINNELLLENEILKTIEELKKSPTLYDNIFNKNYITQSVIHINIMHQNTKKSQKIELHRIFDNYIVNETYPFIQFQTSDGKYIYKYYALNKDDDKDNIISKWFENAPYGVSFKIKVNQKGNKNKYIAVNINENGRIDYKIQWKEEDYATIDDVKLSYVNIRELIQKINTENNKIKLGIPPDDKFKYAFINTIQQFEIPDKYIINHNDLSDFSRYFYPYIAVVVDPKKRQSKVLKKNDKGKYGTYLRYKRISKYEDEISIEKRIIYFIKNYEYNEKLLSFEISKQFNITENKALELIKLTTEKYPYFKKSRNILKTFENIPKHKPPGVGVDIQGKQRENYKIKISGARSKEQLDDIVWFMKIVMYLYIEIYLHKNKTYQQLRDKLITLTNIAKRCNKVEDLIQISESAKTVKQITKLDKERLGYKPEKGQNQWTRNCQNSGKKKRRPIPYTEQNIKEMIDKGYSYNKETGDYEKKIKKGKKIITLKAAKIDNYSSIGNATYYTCNPEENGEYMHVGFLSRSSNPHGLCMPCCFKNDPGTSNNKEKKNYHMQCLGKKTQDKGNTLIGDKLYILQDSIKVQDSRFSYLPEYLDIYLNTMLKKKKIIKNNYLTSSETGWLFRYGTKQDDDVFLNAISNALDLSVQEIKDKIIEKLLKLNNKDSIFTSLNNGDIKSQFISIQYYIQYLETNFEIDFNYIADILSIPGIIFDYGINIIIFEKKNQYNKNNDNKTLKDDYHIRCCNSENIDYFVDVNRINIILIKEDFNYYPIYQVKKNNSYKTIQIDKVYKYEDKEDNIIKHINKFMNLNYIQNNIYNIKLENAKNIFKIIEKYGLKDYYPTKQIVDKKNKCKYFVIQDKYIIPVKPSGALFWIPIETKYEKYITDYLTISDIVYDLYHKSNKEIKIKPTGIYYTNRLNNIYDVEAIVIDNNIIIPIQKVSIVQTNITDYIKKYNIKQFIKEFKSIYDIIDKEIENYNSDKIIKDKRIIEINKDNYYNEGYELFRLELAYYIKDQQKLRDKLIKIITNNKIDNDQKTNIIKRILYKLVNKELFDLFIQTGGNDNDEKLDTFINTNKKLVHISNKEIDTSDYATVNTREVCSTNIVKETCNINKHCSWQHGTCLFHTTKINIIKYINRVISELVYDVLKSSELFTKENYFVSDIVNPNNFIARNNQKIIKSDNNNINKLLSDLFGKNNVPIVGKRRINRLSKNINEDNILNPIEIIGTNIYQNIYNDNVIYRTYANGYYWNNNKLMNMEFRNLGFYNPLQTDLANIFKSTVIDWINNKKNHFTLIDDLKIFNFNKDTIIDEFKQYLYRSNERLYAYFLDLYVLSKINKYTIVLYNVFDIIICVFQNGIKFLLNNKKLSTMPKLDNNLIIHIKYNVDNITLNSNPNIISVIYKKE